MITPTVILLTLLTLQTLFSGLSAMMPPLVSESPECFISRHLNNSSPFTKDCRNFFDLLSVAPAVAVRPILERSAVLTAKPISQGTKNFLRLSHGRCQFTAIGLVENADGASGKLVLTEWVQLWPTFTDSLQYLLVRCVGNNVGGDSLLQYTSTSHVSKVKLLLENKNFQVYPTSLFDFAFDNYRAGGGRGAAVAGMPSSPASSNSSFSRRPSSSANDYRFMDDFPEDFPSQFRLPSGVDWERLREHVCHNSRLCREGFDRLRRNPTAQRVMLQLYFTSSTGVLIFLWRLGVVILEGLLSSDGDTVHIGTLFQRD